MGGLQNHKILLLDQEERLLDKFNLISSPSNYITDRLKGLSQNIRIENCYNGIDKSKAAILTLSDPSLKQGT